MVLSKISKIFPKRDEFKAKVSKNPKGPGWKDYRRSITVGNEISRFTKSFRGNFATLMISAMGLVVALSWNNFWTEWVKIVTVENSLVYKLVIAVLMTVLAVVLTYVFSRFKDNQ